MVAVLVVGVLASGCLGAATTGETVTAKAARADGRPELVPGTVTAVNAFAAALQRATVGQGNVVLAPYAVLRTLAMARAGSVGTTRAELDAALRTAAAGDLDGGLNALDGTMRARTGDRQSRTRKGHVDIEQATALWGQKGTRVKDDFLRTLAAQYGEGLHLVDFRSDSEGGREAINRWSDDQTHGLVTELVSRGGTTPYTRFLAMTAAGLRAPWLEPFDAARTRRDRFTREGEPPVDIRMMELTTELRRTEGAGWQAVELPYLGGELALDLVLPVDQSLGALEGALDEHQLAAVFDGLDAVSPAPTDLRVPRTAFTTSLDLRDALGHLGLQAAFDRTADFSGITNDEVLSLSKVPYEAAFTLEEDGTNPPADTATVHGETAAPLFDAPRVLVDRPFLYAVRDRATDLVLLLGRVVNPG
jgi:serine protease inhibitor